MQIRSRTSRLVRDRIGELSKIRVLLADDRGDDDDLGIHHTDDGYRRRDCWRRRISLAPIERHPQNLQLTRKYLTVT